MGGTFLALEVLVVMIATSIPVAKPCNLTKYIYFTNLTN